MSLPADAFLLTYQAVEKAVRPKQSITVSEWADQHRILSSEGSSMPGKWKTSRTPFLREIMDSLSENSKDEKIVFMKSSQVGGPLCIQTPIATADGWRSMRELTIGESVFDENGLPCKIISVSEIFYNRECFDVVFSDGQKIRCDASHLWAVDDHFPGSGGKKRGVNRLSAIKTTQEIFNTFKKNHRNRYAIPVAQPLELNTATLPISPYLLGYWLANGNLSGNQLTCHDDDVHEIAELINHTGHVAQARKMHWDKGLASNIIFHYADGAKRFLKDIRELGISKEKRIPNLYLRASHSQRRALLKGLMDGDGSIGFNGRAEYSSVSKNLIGDVFELIATLGLKPVIYEGPRKAFSLSPKLLTGSNYRISFIAYEDEPVFALKRKLIKQKSRENCRTTETKRRRIVDVIPCESVPVRCISVDSKSHLYLAGKAMIPTHNTEAGSNWIGYIMDHAKGPVAVVMPTERSLNDWVSQKFDPMASDTPVVAEVLAKRSNKASDNNAQRKKFTGGILYFKTAGSTAELKSTSLRYALADEVDEWEWSTDQGDPLKLLDIRLTAFHDSKYFIVSTPTIKDASHIESEFEGGDQRRYFVPCPHCGELQFLKWNNLRFTKDIANPKKITAVHYFCEHNGCLIEEHHKAAMLREVGHGGQARWIPQAPENPYKSYHINALYSDAMLGKSWRQLAYEWIAAQDDPKDLMVFVNTRLGETYRNATHDIKASLLQQRAEPYALRTVPIGALILTAGVDTQDDRLEIQILGHGRDDKTWPIDYHVIYGNPADQTIWNALADYLKAKFTNHYGRELRIEATAIDTGGHHTHAVYAFCRASASIGIARCIAIKGASTAGRAILGKPSLQDVNWRGQTMKKGVALYTVGTDTAKHLIYNRLNGDNDKDPSQRKVHFSTELPENYYEQLVSEVFNPKKNRWDMKKGKRNEVLDTTVYAIAASHHPELYLHKWKKSDWDKREAMVQPVDMVPNSDGVYEPENTKIETSVSVPHSGKSSLGTFKRGGR